MATCVIGFKGMEGKDVYWAGGEIMSEYGGDAVRFMNETSAENTIDILQKAIRLSKDARVIPLQEVL